MKEPNDTGKSDHSPTSIGEFKERAQRIHDRLDRADRIFDNLQTKETEQKRPDKATDIFRETFESIERGIKKLFSTSSSQLTKPADEQERRLSIVRENLARYLLSCSDEQLAAIGREIDRILKERIST